MTTQEIHIQLDILLQKVSSNWNKNFLPQEIDFFINREILKYIRQRVNPLSNNKRLGAFDVTQRIENLNSLIKTVSFYVNDLNQKEANVQLPFDFLKYISSEINTGLICPEDNIQVEYITKYYQTFFPIDIINGLVSFELTLTYELTSMTPIVVTLFNETMLPTNYLPQDNIEDYKKAFIYNNAMLQYIIANLPNNFECRFNNDIQKFEFKGDESFNVNLVLNYGGSDVIPTVANSSQVLNVYDVDSELVSEVRIIDEEFKTPVKNSNLSGSKLHSLIGILREKEILITKDKNAVYNNFTLTYYKKPRKIDLLLNINSDLPNEVLDEIIDNTAKTLKGVISSDTYEKFAQENLLIE